MSRSIGSSTSYIFFTPSGEESLDTTGRSNRGDENGRVIPANAQIFRIEYDDSVNCSEIHPTGITSKSRTLIQLPIRYAIRRSLRLNAVLRPVVSAQSIIGTQPEIVILVGDAGVDYLTGESIVCSTGNDRVCIVVIEI